MHKSEIRKYNGVPMLFVDGNPVSPMAFDFMPSDPTLTNNIPVVPAMPSEIQLKAMASAGVKLYFVRAEVRDPADFEEMFDKIARSIRHLREHVPGAYAMPWLIISAYEDFQNKYPNDLQTFDDGSVGNYLGVLSGRIPSPEMPRHTHASLAWRHEIAGVLRKLVQRIQEKEELSDTVIGYFFFPLHHEANYFYDYDHNQKVDDYGPSTRLAMRNYLAEKYGGDVRELRKAWGNDTVNFENAPLPDRQSRKTATEGVFWDPARSQAIMDYAEIRSHVWADTLEYFARACKEASHYNAVVGAFWGYLLHTDTLWGGQSYFRKMMDSPFLDFWASPFHYNNRGPGMSVTVRQLTRALQKHGKLFFAEVDTTVSSSLRHERTRQGLIYEDSSRDKEIIKRDFSMILTEGLNGWWTDFAVGHGMYDENDLQPVVRVIEEIGRQATKKPMASVAEVAAVVSQTGLFCTPSESRLTLSAIEYPRLYELPYLGAPIDHYELQDVLDDTLPHKIYIFQNAYLLEKKERDAICSLRKPGRMLIFMYGQGFLSPEVPTADVVNITKLTGIKMRKVEGCCSGRIVLTEQAREFGLVPGQEIGEVDKLITTGMVFHQNKFVPFYPEKAEYDPLFVIDDPEATVLGVYKDNGMPAFAIKTVEGCKCVYIGSAVLNTSVLRSLCRLQDITLYTNEDSIIYANQSYIGIHAVKDGSVTLEFPEVRKLREVFSDETYAADNKLTLELSLGDTRLFEYVE